MIAILVMTDGRDTIEQTIPSAEQQLSGTISERWIHDDTGNEQNARRLERRFPEWTVIRSSGRSGFGGAIDNAWRILRAKSSARFVFHLEDDFTFPRPIKLGDLGAILDAHHHLAQVALRRQPWNADELAAGGIVEQHPADYTEVTDPTTGLSWLEHRRFFTTNPSLYRAELMARRWPRCPSSEGMFSIELFTDPATRSAFLGARSSGESCHHIGTTRVGSGY